MAKAPFATSGNQADIAQVSLKGGSTSGVGAIADAVVNVANIAIPLITQAREDNITEDVEGKIKSVKLALEVHNTPSLADSEFSEEALANPNVRLALDDFFGIQQAVKKNKLPQQFALERLEIIQNNAIRNAPEFEAEIRAAMRDATGQDPQKRLMTQLLSTTGSQSAQQKADERDQIEAIRNNTTVENIRALNASRMVNEVEEQKYDLAAKRGTYGLNIMAKDVTNRGAILITDIMQGVHQTIVAGGSFGVNEKRELIQQVNASFAASTSNIMTRVSGLSVSGTAVQAELAPLNTLRNTVVQMIEDNTLETVLKQYNSVIIDSSINSILSNPDMVMAYAIGGSRGFIDMMNWIQKTGGTEQGKALVARMNEGAKIGFDLMDMAKQTALIGSGNKPKTDQETQTRQIAAGLLMTAPGVDDEKRILALTELKEVSTPEHVWSSFGSKRAMEAVASSTQLKAAFVNMQVHNTAGLSQELLQLASRPELPLERLELNAEGQLQLKKAEGFGTVGRDARLAEGEVQLFMSRFNRSTRIGAQYSGLGIGKYEGAAKFWETVKSAAAKAQVKPTKAAEREVVFGANGELIFRLDGE
jgi:hypothetical protein